MRMKHVAGLLAIIFFFAAAPAWAADTIKLAVMEPLSGTFKEVGDGGGPIEDVDIQGVAASLGGAYE